MSTNLEFRVLGPLEVAEDGRLLPLAGTKQRALLAVLLLHRGEAVPTERLIDQLWEQPPPTAVKSLQVRVSELRKLLGNGVLVTGGGGYGLRLEPDTLDLERFERLLGEGRALLAAGEPGPAAAALRAALALWRGPPLADFMYEPFAQSEIARLEELRLAALEERIEADLALGRDTELIAELDALVRENPLRERLRAELMLALHRCGRQADALEVYKNARRTFVDELGIEPTRQLRELERSILTQDRSLDAPAARRRLARRVQRRARRGALLVAGGAALLLAAAIGAAVVAITRSGDSAALASVSANSVGVIDPGSDRIVAEIPVGSGPTSVTVGEGAVWVGNAGERTLAAIDPRTKRVVARVGLGRIPSQLAVGDGTVWVASAIGGRGVVFGVQPQASAVVSTTTVRVGDEGDLYAPATPSAIAVGAGVVWTNHVRSKVTHFRAGATTAETLDLGSAHSADGIAVGEGAVWIASSADDKLLRVDPARSRVAAVIPIAARPRDRVAGPYSVVVGYGSIWVANALADTVSRVDPALGAVTATIPVGRRPTRIAVGEGAVWALNVGDGTVTRIDPRTSSASATIRVGKVVTGIAAGAGAVWVTVGGGPIPSAGRAAVAGFKPLPSSMCSAVYHDRGEPDLLIVSGLPTQLYGVRSPIIRDLRAAIRLVLERRGFRAGKYEVGYQACDDSSLSEGQDDPERCAANARAYAANQSVLGVIGPFRSFCAALALPILNAAPGGPIATLSPSNTYVGLTHAGPATAADEPDRYYPTGVRNYVRLVGADDVQGQAIALFARQLGVKRVYVLDDGEGTGQAMTRYVSAAAKQLGLTVAGVSSWDPTAKTYAPLAAKVRRTRPDAVVLAGCMCLQGRQLVRDLRLGLGTRVTFVGSDNFTTSDVLSEADARALDGLYIVFAGRPVEALPAKGRRFLRSFDHGRPVAATEPYVVYAAQAADLLLDAIARSDGTRASVATELVRSRVHDGVVGSFHFTATGDPTPTPIGIYRLRARAPVYATRIAKRLVFDRVIEPPFVIK